MARFRADVQGRGGPDFRLGNDRIYAYARGWTGGVKIEGRFQDRKEVYEIWLTKGEHGKHQEPLLLGVLEDGVFTPDVAAVRLFGKAA